MNKAGAQGPMKLPRGSTEFCVILLGHICALTLQQALLPAPVGSQLIFLAVPQTLGRMFLGAFSGR